MDIEDLEEALKDSTESANDKFKKKSMSCA
jgi:hypothetical protein